MFQVHACPTTQKAYDGRYLRSFSSYPAAKRYAESRVFCFHNGTLIIDTVRDIADWGNEWTEANDGELAVARPFYAKRYEGR